MRFDTIIYAPCENPNSPAAQPTTCGGQGGGGDDGGGGEDPRCSDPVFAAQHPGICLNAPRLIVKPDYSLREVGSSIEYRAFLWANGEETEVTDSVVWNTSNNFVAALGQDGHATALAVGIVTISAKYGLLNGYAQLEVIAEGACSTEGNTYVLVLDNSESAGSAFTDLYPSRLAFAKEQAKAFLDNVDFDKDKAAVVSFSSSGTVLIEESQDVTALKAAVSAIPITQNQTNIKDALVVASEMEVTGRRIIILFTDGENKEGGDPVEFAISLRSAQNYIIGVGLRASGNGFRMLNRIANGGFFLNAIEANQDSIQTYLSGLQSYLCSGNCAPEGDGFYGVGELNFDAFTQWDVVEGHVDLIGKNVGGPELFDLVPGNGLYVDDHGSSEVFPGVLATKAALALVSGHNYRLTVEVAGHNRPDPNSRQTLVRVCSAPDTSSPAYIDDLVTRAKSDPFTESEFDFTVSGVTDLYIVLAGQTGTGEQSFGNLIKNVTLEDLTAASTIFSEDWNDENLQFIPPGCGQSASYSGYSTYCYGYGCLDEPIPAQVPDSNPLEDIEA